MCISLECLIISSRQSKPLRKVLGGFKLKKTTTMKEELITFETAKLAKEKGFPQEPNKLKIPYYNYKGEFKGDVKDWLRKYLRKEDTSDVESVSAPTQSLLQRWLREKHNIIITIEHWTNQPVNNQIWENCYDYNFQQLHHGTTPHKTYEQALEEGLYKALKFIKPN